MTEAVTVALPMRSEDDLKSRLSRLARLADKLEKLAADTHSDSLEHRDMFASGVATGLELAARALRRELGL